MDIIHFHLRKQLLTWASKMLDIPADKYLFCFVKEIRRDKHNTARETRNVQSNQPLLTSN